MCIKMHDLSRTLISATFVINHAYLFNNSSSALKMNKKVLWVLRGGKIIDMTAYLQYICIYFLN